MNINSAKSFMIFGLGKSGIASVKFLLAKNKTVYATDDNLSLLEKNPHINTIVMDVAINTKVDILVVSPGIRTKFNPHPLILSAKESGIMIVSDLDIFYHYYPQLTYIGITGTNGKSTVVSLLYHIMRLLKIDVLLGGNIGIPILDLCPSENTFMIIEVSSYQLEISNIIEFDHVVILNIAEDHTMHHGSMETYIDVKKSIFSARNKSVVLNYDDEIVKNIANTDNVLWYSIAMSLEHGVSILDHKLYINSVCFGEINVHNSMNSLVNISNIAACVSILFCLGYKSDDFIKLISTFIGLPHRCEYVHQINNILFINDSKATNVHASKSTISHYHNIFLIAGGIMKSDNVSDIINLAKRIRKIFLFGKDASNITKCLNNKIQYDIYPDMGAAIDAAYNDAKKFANHDQSILYYVILSPFCASFDQYIDFNDRGECFKRIVRLL